MSEMVIIKFIRFGTVLRWEREVVSSQVPRLGEYIVIVDPDSDSAEVFEVMNVLHSYHSMKDKTLQSNVVVVEILPRDDSLIPKQVF